MINKSSDDNTNRIEHIDVWRCIAVCLVIFTHIIYFSHPWYKEVFPGLVWRASPLGGLGVQLFFCISGFVICRGMVKESLKNGQVNMRAFYVRRAFRIFPPLLLYIAVLALLSFAGFINVQLNQGLSSIAFLCNVRMIDCGWFLGHTWSLAFEEQFYMVFPVLFLLCSLALRRNRLLAIAFSLFFITIVTKSSGHEIVGYYVSTFSFMLWGCVFALYWKELGPLLEKIPLPIWLLCAVALPASHMIAMPDLFNRVAYPAVGPLACCIVIFSTPSRHFSMRPIFNNLKLQYIGRMSYSIYLWQQLAVKDFGFSSPIPTLFFIPILFVISHFSFRYFEERMITIGAKISERLLKSATGRADSPLIFSSEGSNSIDNHSIRK